MSGLEVAVNIPLLSEEPSGPPSHSLALAKFYDRRRGDIPKANILYPYKPVDKIVMDDCHVVVQNGDEEIRANFQRAVNPCVPSPDKVDDEIKRFMGSDFHFGNPEPHFAFCDRHSFDNDFCNAVKSVRTEVQQEGPNICQFWRIDDVHSCATTTQINTMTKYFRDFILLENDPLEIVASETMKGNFSIGLKYPCLVKPSKNCDKQK
ncbi:hypothetical protein HOLleu_36660 [Holothuria leucospilota]|uniref:Uncharacterized protein n=1 Tax=Holothuria leucospilota TaxID=206669 RepID=A0A9Q1BGS9_HOLLE|nr:hypothetical protein HOLleu_36660 [Holothuria leucospilota]